MIPGPLSMKIKNGNVFFPFYGVVFSVIGFVQQPAFPPLRETISGGLVRQELPSGSNRNDSHPSAGRMPFSGESDWRDLSHPSCGKLLLLWCAKGNADGILIFVQIEEISGYVMHAHKMTG